MKILIVGIGSLGSLLTKNLASDVRDEHKITVMDKDKVEERNVQANTQAYVADMVGLPKTEILQFILHEMNRKIDIINADITQYIAFPETFEHRIGDKRFDLFVDCTDNFAARTTLKKTCGVLPCVHLGFGKYTWSILWNEEYQPPETAVEWDICELPGASSFVHMVAAIGSSVIQEFLTTGKKREFCGNRFSIREVK